MTASKKKSEKEIQKKILRHLNDEGIFCWRNNSGMFFGEHKGKRRAVQFGIPGMPDIIAIVRGYFVGIEVKGPRGKQSDHQKAFEKNVEYAGGYYAVVRSVDDTKKLLASIPSV